MSDDRHAQLTAAGWRYDAGQDRYQAPGADPLSGTWHNRDAAWLRERQRRAAAAGTDVDPTPRPKGKAPR